MPQWADRMVYLLISVIDCLHAGPALIHNLVKLLVRLRKWPVAPTADKSKAFFQICL